MRRPNSTQVTFGGWGIVIGAILAMVIGFHWGGWVTESTAKADSQSVLLASRASICAAQFAEAPNHTQRLTALTKTSSWKRSDFIAQGGWDRMPGQKTASAGVAQACVDAMQLPANQ